jgi:hypothetical protein
VVKIAKLIFTCTPKIPKIMKNVQQMRTMFPMGLSDDNNVCTTSFRPGALFMTRSGRRDRSSLKTCNERVRNALYVFESKHTLNIPNILGLLSDITDISQSTIDIKTSNPSIMFQPEVK